MYQKEMGQENKRDWSRQTEIERAGKRMREIVSEKKSQRQRERELEREIG